MTSTVKTKNSAASLMQSIGFLPSVLQSPLNRNILEAVGGQAGTIQQHEGRTDLMPGLKPFVVPEHGTGGESCVLPEVPFPPSLRSGSMASRFPLQGGQGSWHEVRTQPASSQSSLGKISHLLPQAIKMDLGLTTGSEDIFSIDSESQLNMQSFKDCKAQKRQKQ